MIKRKLQLELLEKRQLLHGVAITETHAVTDHDNIPRFAASAEYIAVKDGNWSDPWVWNQRRAPGKDATVQIPAGIDVDYDVENGPSLDAIEVSGRLDFATNSDTSLWVNEIMVMPSGALTLGTTANPVDSEVVAEIVFTDTPDEAGRHFKTGTTASPGIDPEQYGNGLIVFGEFISHGADKQAFIRSTSDIERGATIINTSALPANWNVGDELALPETAQTPYFAKGIELNQSEVVEIASISSSQIGLATGATFAHAGIADNPFGIDVYAHVANLTRNVVIRSENPAGVRGHFMATAHATVDIDNTLFLALGRTSADGPVDDTLYDDGGSVIHIGDNQVGRYSVHFHHMMHPFEMSGSVVRDGLKWGITVHATSNSLIENNVVYDTDGAAIVTEAGTEVNNRFIGNFVAKVDGGYQRNDKRAGVQWHQDFAGKRFLDVGSDGSGFWLRATAGTLEDNVVYDAAGYGYNFNGYYRTQRSPGFRLEQIDSFKNNESVSSLGGFWLTWSQGQQRGLVDYQRQTFENLLVWHMKQDGVHTYHDGEFTLNGFTVIADPAVSNINEGSHTRYHTRTTTGLYFGNPSYENHNIVLNGTQVSGTSWGIVAPVVAGTQGMILDTATLESHVNIAFPEKADRETLTARNVVYLPSQVLQVGNASPVETANVWQETIGTIEAGVTAPGATDLKPPTLPSTLSLREDGKLVVAGSAGDDDVTIRQEGDKLEILSGGVETSIDRALVLAIHFSGHAGNDSFKNMTNIPSRILGGEGNDFLQGGSAIDIIYGGDGNDVLIGGGGDDIIYGESGDDELFGDEGDDRLRGGDGDDTIWGGDGSDPVLDGGNGADIVFGEHGNDRLRGGLGDDLLNGGDGNDILKGDDGADELNGGLGDDVLYGGSGNDVLSGDDGIDKYRPGTGADWLFLSDIDFWFDLDDEDVLVFLS